MLGVGILLRAVRRSEVICIEIALGIFSGTLEIPLLVSPQEISSAARQSREEPWMGRGRPGEFPDLVSQVGAATGSRARP